MLFVVGLFTFYSMRELDGLRKLQANTIDGNRRDSLQLIRIQNDLNTLGLAMRDMLEDSDGYGIEAWRGEFARLRFDFSDALKKGRAAAQRQNLEQALSQFWQSAEQIFAVAEGGEQNRARRMVIDSLQAQQSSLSNTVARLLVRNNEAEEAAAKKVSDIYDKGERNLILFLAGILSGITAIGLGAVHYNRRLFDRMAALSEQRSTLARRLIGVQEEVFRSVARELHDDFGQVLTAVGTMLRRIEKKGAFDEDIIEIRQAVGDALERTRSFSQALHPTILDDYGLGRAVERYVETWQKQTGIPVALNRSADVQLPDSQAIHVYRILQEALNNVAKHANATQVSVALQAEEQMLRLEILDDGVGISVNSKNGLGLIAMRERAELIHGRISFGRGVSGGTLVKLEVPIEE
ncbi:MAG: sensor histidine kinase [Bryobacteraceae bacterium]|nr:sensor histidine kinase [Bryobacteraceae bacterium]